MALLTIDQNPTIADTIHFDILTPSSNGCAPADAYSNNTYIVNQVTIYFVERDFTTPDSEEIEFAFPHPDSALEAAAATAQTIACQTPTTANIAAAKLAQSYANAALTTTPFYYKGVEPIAVFGSPDFPAWLRTTPADSILQQYVNPDTTLDPGHFTLDWSPDDAREGDYFICWSWQPLPAGDHLSAYQPFYLLGNTAITTAIPIHYTTPGKYVTLLENYLPEMFRTYLCATDITPDVFEKFHAAIAKGFTDIENLANQIIDLLDANVIQEALLPYLSNLFNLKLRSNDPTLWRRQIKNAVPFFMQKGTLVGLTNALAQSGITLSNYTSLWQITSKYTYTDMFYNTGQSLVLSFALVNIDVNFLLNYRPAGSDSYVTLSSSYVSFVTTDGVTTMTWLGATQSPKYVLGVGDLIVVRYLMKTMPGGWQSNETYLQSLDLADQRDAINNGNLLIPLKNWNVYLIEEDDPLFSVLIPTRQPYENFVVFGKVRTEFAYSENIYNMETYNGSKRDSTNPCDIDVNFLDSCSACSSSKFILDVEIQELSNDTIKETADIIQEFSPFHAILHKMNISGGINEFVVPPVEYVETLIMVALEENVIAGNANDVFTRWHFNDYVFQNVPWSEIKRNVLAEFQSIITSTTGTAYNSSINLYCSDVLFDQLPISNKTLLKILSPSPNTGSYSVSSPTKHTLQVSGVSEPLNQSVFTFRLSNLVYSNPSSALSQSDYFELNDSNLNFGILGVVSQWDFLNQVGIIGSSWEIIMIYGTFLVADVSPDGNLVLDDPDRLLPTSGASGLTYSVIDGNSNTIASSTTGKINCSRRGIVHMSDVNVSNINTLVQIGFYASYAGNEYMISGFVPETTNSVYIDGYTSGSAGGVLVNIYHRRTDNEIGYFNYMGLLLDAGYDIESALNVQNGSNPPAIVLDNDEFMENYLILIDTTYYKMVGINHNIITLSGPPVDYQTQNAGGTTMTYSVIQLIKNYTNQSVNIDGEIFNVIDRRGNDLCFREPLIFNAMPDEGILAITATDSVNVIAHDVPESFIGITAAETISVTAIVVPEISVAVTATDSEQGAQIFSETLSIGTTSGMMGGNDGGALSTLAMNMLNKGSNAADVTSQQEDVSFTIEYLNNNQGNL